MLKFIDNTPPNLTIGNYLYLNKPDMGPKRLSYPSEHVEVVEVEKVSYDNTDTSSKRVSPLTLYLINTSTPAMNVISDEEEEQVRVCMHDGEKDYP
ncbi:hypothetical protein QJS10_CPB04g01281 [Acorus calamus]|uniref:Uncharacterized protein n=1 Tax=Acorus calamus TaxID=4465 RepID=A0AAV9F180_ACOCL|nr:hypothetical protein QJS10_CPB04g01281 [Acorus calamus]